MTSHAFTPPPAVFGRDVVIISYHGRMFGLIVMSGARLAVVSERISHGWFNGGAEVARPDNAAPYCKDGHRETRFSVRVDAHYKFMFDSASII